MPSRVVVIGGYGNFGARICRALAGDPGIEVIAAGRRPPRAFGSDGISAARLDTGAADFSEALRKLSPGVVIHCAGPFQHQDYRVALAAVAAGAHYVDLADGRRFVARFAGAVHAAAKTAGVTALSGASTLPGLSSAVVDAHLERFRELREIDIAIAPAQRAARGAATIAGVMSYAGRPFDWLKDGRWTKAWGWQELKVVRIAGLGTRLAAACDVPDLELLPTRYPTVRTVAFRAALESKAQQAGIWLAAGLRRAGVPVPLEWGAGALDRVAAMFDFLGGETGGMLVAIEGITPEGRVARIEWHLTAPSNHGPEIPCMAALLLARKLAAGTVLTTGAFACMGFLALSEFEPELARWNITSTVREIPLP